MRACIIPVVVLLLGFAPAPLPRKQRPREDPTDVAGKWEFVLWEYNGQRHQELEKTYHVQMTREKFSLVMRGSADSPFEMRLEPSYSPQAFTWRTRSLAYVGSYRLRGDQMTMIFDTGGSVAERPTNFEGGAKWRFVLRRVGR